MVLVHSYIYLESYIKRPQGKKIYCMQSQENKIYCMRVNIRVILQKGMQCCLILTSITTNNHLPI